MKKLLLIALVLGGFALASAPNANAGVSVGIGLGIPVGYYGYGYPYGCAPYHYYRPVAYAGPSFYRYHGHRVYYTHRFHRTWR